MIIKDKMVLDQAGIFPCRKNDNTSPITGGSIGVYRVYVGDKMVYPHSGFLPGSDPLAIPYRLVVSYQFIHDRLTLYTSYGISKWRGSIKTINRIITVETTFPCYVKRITSFPDYVNLMDTSAFPHIDVSQALVVILPAVERGSWIKGYYGNDARGPSELSEYKYWRRPAEADTTFIHEATSSYETNEKGEIFNEQNSEMLYFFLPETYAWSFYEHSPILDKYDDERLLLRANLFPEAQKRLLFNTSKHMGTYEVSRDMKLQSAFSPGYPGGLGSVPFNIVHLQYMFAYPMFNQLVDGTSRQISFGRVHGIQTYSNIPFYEMYDGTIKGDVSWGQHDHYYCNYTVLENSNPYFDSYENWARKVHLSDGLGI